MQQLDWADKEIIKKSKIKASSARRYPPQDFEFREISRRFFTEDTKEMYQNEKTQDCH